MSENSPKGSVTVNFSRNFLALSKCPGGQSCASAQGREGKKKKGGRGEGVREGIPSPEHNATRNSRTENRCAH